VQGRFGVTPGKRRALLFLLARLLVPRVLFFSLLTCWFAGTAGLTVTTPCQAGSFQIAVGASMCLRCPAGSVQPATGSSLCLPCPAGQFTNQSGLVDCNLCPAGTDDLCVVSALRIVPCSHRHLRGEYRVYPVQFVSARVNFRAHGRQDLHALRPGVCSFTSALQFLAQPHPQGTITEDFGRPRCDPCVAGCVLVVSVWCKCGARSLLDYWLSGASSRRLPLSVALTARPVRADWTASVRSCPHCFSQDEPCRTLAPLRATRAPPGSLRPPRLPATAAKAASFRTGPRT
jgi:hypothetical protein